MILAIGYGNPLCGDDGIGPYAIGRLADSGTEPEFHGSIECLSLHQLTPELAEPISRAQAVVFIDAACGNTPGGITCYKLARPSNPAGATPGAFTHNVNPESLLKNAESLYGRRPVAYLYTVSGENFNLGDSFSPAVEAALPRLLERLKARIVRCMNLVSLNR
jgi:hydrogenase maturation protease